MSPLPCWELGNDHDTDPVSIQEPLKEDREHNGARIFKGRKQNQYEYPIIRIRKKLRLHSAWKKKEPFKAHYSWTKPLKRYYKLNVSGLKCGGYGAILRDDVGYTRAAVAGFSEPVSALYHQLQGVEAGLVLAIKHIKCDWLGLNVEVPSYYVSSVIDSGTLFGEDKKNPLVCSILSRVQRLMSKLNERKCVGVNCCGKGTNNAAVYLSMYHACHSGFHGCLSEFHGCLSEYYGIRELDVGSLPDVLNAIVEEEAKNRLLPFDC